MVFDLSAEISNWGGIIMGAALPVILLYYFSHVEKKRNRKELAVAAELKEHDEKVANELKISSVAIADDLREASVTIATELQVHLDAKISDINKSIEDLGQRIDRVKDNQSDTSKRVDTISANQLKTHQDQLDLITSLQRRADMTNGNVENIRNDIMDVQGTIEDINDNMYELPPLNTRKRRRKVKRQKIAADASYQDDIKHRFGSGL